MNASCHLSIEFDTEIPLTVIVSKLRQAADWVASFEKVKKGEELHEIKGFREEGVKIGQVDLDVQE